MKQKLGIKIYFDVETGEVCDIKPTIRFEQEGSLFKLDVLKDAIKALKVIYNYEKEQFIKEMTHIEMGES